LESHEFQLTTKETSVIPLSYGALSALASLALAATLLPATGVAQTASVGKPPDIQLLFVQSAKSATLSKDGRLTLKGVSPTTLYFSDRPTRIAGHYRNAEYMQFWQGGKDSFLKDPPNATLSAFQSGKDELVDVVMTLRNARLRGDEITYDVKIIDGKLPQPVGPVSLFIDIIGLPFTPLSFAGVARRTAYRSVMWGSAATSAAAANEAAAYAARPPAPAPTTVNITTTPAAAPPASTSQAAIVSKLKELKSLLNQGLITQSQYNADSQKLVNELTQ
jgi:hypothetical protein